MNESKELFTIVLSAKIVTYVYIEFPVPLFFCRVHHFIIVYLGI